MKQEKTAEQRERTVVKEYEQFRNDLEQENQEVVESGERSWSEERGTVGEGQRDKNTHQNGSVI